MHFQPYPFERLHQLLQDIKPNSNFKPITLTIGEPQFQTPEFIRQKLCQSSDLLNKYPKTAGEENLRKAICKFVYRRFGVNLDNTQVIPTFGTREVLFNFPQFLLFDKQNPVMAYTNPFYQIYEGAAIASRAEVIYINLLEENNFKPVIDEDELSRCDFVIINFPNNPTASTLTLDELGEWVKLALKHDFVLLNDECYSEIYTQSPPPSLLEASLHVNNLEFKNIVVVNSISKRSSAPGLRSGFIAGDKTILNRYLSYRTYVGAASPLPLQEAAAVAWMDEEHVKRSRAIYRKNFQIASRVLDIKIPPATFYIWLKVKNPIAFTCKAYEQYNIKVLPGVYLAREDKNGINPADGYVRIALVEDEQKSEEALMRIKECLCQV